MIVEVAGNPRLWICQTCNERWVGVYGEPRTEDWFKAHDGKHGTINMPLIQPCPRGFDMPALTPPIQLAP